jgi:hypothetical protein
VVSLANSINLVGNALGAGLSAVRANAVRQLNDTADKLSRSPAGAQPIVDLLLNDRLFGLIDAAIARIGLVLQRVDSDNGAAAKFYRLPTQMGRAALISLPAKILGDSDRALDVGLIGPALAGAAAVAFVVTEAKEIDDTYEFSLWPSWKNAGYFRDVKPFTAKFFDFLAAQPVDKRLDVLAVNFGLDVSPPATVTMDPQDHDCFVDLLLGRALDPTGTPRKILGDLVEGLYVDNKAKGQIAAKLAGDDVNVVCRELLDWASGLRYPQGHVRQCRYTVLGTLLEALSRASGLEQRQKLVAIAESYGLIRDRTILAQLREAPN